MNAQPKAFRADGNISPSRFVSASLINAYSIAQADGTAPILGVARDGAKYAPLPATTNVYAAEAGDSLPIHVEGNVLVEAGATVTTGALVMADGNGKAIVVTGTGTEYIGGTAVTGGAAGELIQIQVRPGVQKLA